MLSKLFWVAALGAALAGCAATPQKTLSTLDAADPKFNTPECNDIRARSLTYDDKIGERMAVGFVSGLLLGPFGIPIAAAADAQQNDQRKMFNREIALRCMSHPTEAQLEGIIGPATPPEKNEVAEADMSAK